MVNELHSGLFVLAGTLVGGGVTIFVQWLTNKQQTKKEFIKLATELGNEKYKLAKENVSPGGILHPVESFITYYIKYFELMNSKNISTSKLKELDKFKLLIDKYYNESDSPSKITYRESNEY